MRNLKKYHQRKSVSIGNLIAIFYNVYHIKHHYYVEVGIRIKEWVIFITIKNRW